MEFISAEKFLKQPIEIQEIFLDWWKPSEGDLFVFDVNRLDLKECVLNVSDDYIKGINTFYNPNECIPLLVEGHLRKFIEDKTENILLFNYFNGYYLERLSKVPKKLKNINLGSDLLKVYWEIALEIAKEKVKA